MDLKFITKHIQLVIASTPEDFLTIQCRIKTTNQIKEEERFVPINDMADLQAVNDILSRDGELPSSYGVVSDLPDPESQAWKEVPYAR